jgi:hypothetical protein
MNISKESPSLRTGSNPGSCFQQVSSSSSSASSSQRVKRSSTRKLGPNSAEGRVQKKPRRKKRVLQDSSSEGDSSSGEASSSKIQMAHDHLLTKKRDKDKEKARQRRGEKMLQSALEKSVVPMLPAATPMRRSTNFHHIVFGGQPGENFPNQYDRSIKKYLEQSKGKKSKNTFSSRILSLRHEAVRDLIVDQVGGVGPVIAGYQKEYLEFIKKEKKMISEWEKFERILKQYPAVIEFIQKYAGSPQDSGLQDKFFDVLQYKRAMLYALLLSDKSLYYFFKEFRRNVSECFSFGGVSESAYQECDQYWKKQSVVPTPTELHMLSLIFRKQISLYVSWKGKCMFVRLYGSKCKGSKVQVQINERNLYQRLEQNPGLRFYSVLRGQKSKKCSGGSQDLQDANSIIRQLKVMYSILDSRNVSEKELISQAFNFIKKIDTSPAERIEIASLLARMGYLVHGNFDPKGKEFKPEKITMFAFEEPFLSLVSNLRSATAREIKRYDGGKVIYAKKNKLVANIAFNITYIDDGIKKRKIIYLPVVLSKSVYEEVGQHSEIALYAQLKQKDVIDKILSRVGSKLSDDLNLPVDRLSIYKINAIVIQMASRFRSCDDCHDKGLSIFERGQLIVNFESRIKAKGWRIPKNKENPGLSSAIQFNFNFSPLTEKSKNNSYTKPLYSKSEFKQHRRNFLSDNVFVQRNSKKVAADSDPDKNYSLFLSNGYDLIKLPIKGSGGDYEKLLSLSVEQEDINEALKEWEYTGKCVRLAQKKSGDCEVGPHKITFVYTILNIFTGHTLEVGSECVKKFDGMMFYDEQGLVADVNQQVKKQKSESKRAVSSLSSSSSPLSVTRGASPDVNESSPERPSLLPLAGRSMTFFSSKPSSVLQVSNSSAPLFQPYFEELRQEIKHFVNTHNKMGIIHMVRAFEFQWSKIHKLKQNVSGERRAVLHELKAIEASLNKDSAKSQLSKLMYGIKWIVNDNPTDVDDVDDQACELLLKISSQMDDYFATSGRAQSEPSARVSGLF